MLELAERCARLDPELVDERPTGGLVGLERVGLATAAVERQHQLSAQPLAKWVVVDELFELGDQLGARPEEEPGLDQVLERRGAKLFEPSRLERGERLEGEVGERLPAPQSECLLELLDAILPLRGTALARQPLEASEVDLLGRDVQEVPAAVRDEDSRSQCAAKLGDVVLQGGPCGSRRLLAPQRVDQRVAGNGLARPEQQQGK